MKLQISGHDVVLPFVAEKLNLVESGVTVTPRVVANDRRLDLTLTASGGGLSDGDKGDITVGGGGTTLTIDNDAVTFAKMQDLSSNVLVGCEAGGDPIEVGPQLPIQISGGKMSIVSATVEPNLGATAKWTGRFTITDAAINASSRIQCWQAPGPYTGKGTRADEAEMQPVQVIAVAPASGSATVYWQTPPSFSEEWVIPNGNRDSPSTVVGFDPRYPYVQTVLRRKGMVRGNVKFSYVVL